MGCRISTAHSTGLVALSERSATPIQTSNFCRVESNAYIMLKHTQSAQFKTSGQKPYPIYDQNGQNRYHIYDQNGWKTIPSEAAHTYIAHII